MDNITKVRYYGCDFGKRIPNLCPRWKKDKENYDWLQKHFKEKKLKNDSEKGVEEKVLNLRSRYKLARCLTKEAIPEAIGYMHQNKEMLYKQMKLGDKKIVGEIALNLGHKSKGLKRQMCFATKLCFFHNETAYPICDSCAWAALAYHKKKLPKTHPNYEKLNTLLKNANHEWYAPPKFQSLNYTSYKNAIDYFIKIYDLDDITYKELDWFLWVFGKISLGNPRAEILKKMALIPKTS